MGRERRGGGGCHLFLFVKVGEKGEKETRKPSFICNI